MLPFEYGVLSYILLGCGIIAVGFSAVIRNDRVLTAVGIIVGVAAISLGGYSILTSEVVDMDIPVCNHYLLQTTMIVVDDSDQVYSIYGTKLYGKVKDGTTIRAKVVTAVLGSNDVIVDIYTPTTCGNTCVQKNTSVTPS